MVQNKTKRKCRYIPTGKIYESVVEMCNDLGFSEHKARHQIHGRVKNTLQIEFVSESFVGKKLKSRICSSCGIEKDINLFGFEKNGTSRSRCKKCRSNKEKERRDSKTSKQLRIERIASTYKTTKKQAEILYNVKNCQCCGIKLIQRKGKSKMPSNGHVIDHCHTTGKIRGVLCSGCNLAIGHSRENIDILNKLINYLKINK